MTPTVSIVIPCHNVENYVADAIESALNQTYSIDNIICVDDGSADTTLELLREFECRNSPRLKVITGPNKGGNHARNKGLAYVHADYVQFLDADDLLHPDKISHQIGLIQTSGEPVDLVVAGFISEASSGGSYSSSPARLPGTASEWINLARGAMGKTSAQLWRTSAIGSIGGWNTAWPDCQEYELMFRMLANGAHVIYDRSARTTIVRREGSLTSNGKIARWERLVQLRAMILDYARSNDFPACEVELIEQVLFSWIRKLSALSRESACLFYDRCLDSSFIPWIDFNARLYILGYKIFGFRGVEILYHLLPRKVLRRIRGQ